MTAILILFILCSILLLTLLLYPLFTWLWSNIVQVNSIPPSSHLEPVSIIIACCNEEAFIQSKIESFLHPSEWINGSEIIVIPNNTTDKTIEILRKYANHPRVKVHTNDRIRSKIAAVNAGVSLSKNNILVFSDCRQKMKQGSVIELVKNFSDPSIGTVNSTLVESGKSSAFSLRNVINFTASCDSKYGSGLNLYGALYAQKKPVFRTIPEDLLFDDLFQIVSTLSQGKRIYAEKNAVIYDIPFDTYYQKNRIHRLARGLLIFLFNHHRLIFKLPVPTLFRFLVLKYFKLLFPALLLLIVGCGFVLWPNIASQLMVIVLVVALLGSIIRPVRNLVFYSLFILFHLFLGTIQFLSGLNRSNKWDKLNIPDHFKTSVE